MKTIPKWRDLIIDPFKINFKNIEINKIVSYPHAGNDVLECIGIYDNQETSFILKIERSKMANFSNEVKILEKLSKKLLVPTVYEFGSHNNHKYIVLSKMTGRKLSEIHGEGIDINSYLYKYGKKLATIHGLSNITSDKAMQRVINDIPKENEKRKFESYELSIINYLEETKPIIDYDTFIHGDFHYGNILWENGEISAILDFEYSGLGFKEQDIAWSLILRPGQKFLTTIKEVEQFLKSYKEKGDFDKDKLTWCLVNGYLHFYLMNKNSDEEEYLNILKKIISHYMKNKVN